MAKQVKRRRGTTAQHGSFVGAEGEITIDTSNNDYKVILDPGGYDGDINYQAWVISVLADMDASDTAVVKVYQQAGSAQVNLISGSYTYFSGYLVA